MKKEKRRGRGHIVPLLLLLPLLLLQMLLLSSPFVPVHSHHSVAPVTRSAFIYARSRSSALICPHVRALVPLNACPQTLDSGSDTEQGKSRMIISIYRQMAKHGYKGLQNPVRTPNTAQLVVQ